MNIELEVKKLKNIQDRIKQKKEELADLTAKESSMQSKILNEYMSKNNINLLDILGVLENYKPPERDTQKTESVTEVVFEDTVHGSSTFKEALH